MLFALFLVWSGRVNYLEVEINWIPTVWNYIEKSFLNLNSIKQLFFPCCLDCCEGLTDTMPNESNIFWYSWENRFRFKCVENATQRLLVLSSMVFMYFGIFIDENWEWMCFYKYFKELQNHMKIYLFFNSFIYDFCILI